MPMLGAYISIAGGVSKAFARAEEIEAFTAAWRESSVASVVVALLRSLAEAAA